MVVVTSRADFEKLIILRMREAKHLLEHQDWDGAYYLAGYPVEFAFKIRIISQWIESDSFPEKKLVDNFYKHDLSELRTLAGLGKEMDKDDAVTDHWEIVKDWSEQTRYQICKTEKQATDLYESIEKGVLPWVKARC